MLNEDECYFQPLENRKHIKHIMSPLEERSEDEEPLLGSGQGSSYPKPVGDVNGCIPKHVHRKNCPLLPIKRNGYGTCENWATREDITLTWRDLSVYVKEKKKTTKEILHNVSGTVVPRRLTAVMGASGAGKSTLMNSLAHRTDPNMIVTGDINVNGCSLDRSIVQYSGYVPQHKLFLGTLTVKEHLTFMARLKMPRSSTPRQREERVKELLRSLGLVKVQDTLIGVPNTDKSISGGERRRLSFATEIITDPQLLFCDEPTTGLDAYNARGIVTIMKNMAIRGKTIISTIHQPSSEVFEMFDNILFLAEGRLAYMGSSADALHFWESLGHKCPSTFNPADHYINTLAVLPGHETHSRERIKRICDNFAISAYCKDIDMTIQYQHKEETLVRNIPEKPGWLVEFLWLTWRSLINSYRNPSLHIFMVIRKIIIALMFAGVFSNIHLDQTGIQDIQGFLLIFLTQACSPVFFQVMDEVHAQLPLFFQEYKDGIYGCDTYYFSRMIAVIPGLLVETVLFTVIAYWGVGLQPDAYSFTVALITILCVTLTSTACAVMIGATFEHFDSIMVFSTIVHLVNLICCGLFANIESLSWFTSWMKFLTWLLYGNEVLTITQWSGVKNITCELPEAVSCISTGQEVIEKYGYQPSHLSFDFSWLMVEYCIYHTIGFTVLCVRARRK